MRSPNANSEQSVQESYHLFLWIKYQCKFAKICLNRTQYPGFNILYSHIMHMDLMQTLKHFLTILNSSRNRSTEQIAVCAICLVVLMCEISFTILDNNFYLIKVAFFWIFAILFIPK